MRNGPEWNAELVARVPTLALPCERAFCCEFREITSRRGRRSSSDGAVLSCAHPAFEAFRPFPEHSEQRLLLSLVDLFREAIE